MPDAIKSEPADANQNGNPRDSRGPRGPRDSIDPTDSMDPTDPTNATGPLAPQYGILLDIELEATLQFGSRELPLREVLELGPGDVVELDRHVSEPVDLVVGDRIVARGEVVVQNGNFALRITEVATPQLRLESIRCLF